MRKEFLKLMAIAVFFSGMEIAANAQELSNYQSQRLLRPKRTDTCGEPNRLCALTVGQVAQVTLRKQIVSLRANESKFVGRSSQTTQVKQLDRLSQQVDLVLPSVAEVILKNPANESKSGDH